MLEKTAPITAEPFRCTVYQSKYALVLTRGREYEMRWVGINLGGGEELSP